jgi:hypothetical protein
LLPKVHFYPASAKEIIMSFRRPKDAIHPHINSNLVEMAPLTQAAVSFDGEL